MQTKNREEIERAAQRILDEAGPEKVKRFLESYEDGVPRMSPAHTVELTIPPADDDPDLSEYVHTIIYQAGGKMSDAEKALLFAQCEEYLHSAAFTKELAKKRAIFTRAESELIRLQTNLRNRHLDFDHGIDIENLADALMQNTKLNIVIPVPKMPKKLGHEFTLDTTAPLTTPKRHVICLLNECLIDLAAFARHFKSESERDFKTAYILALKTAGGPRAGQEDVASPFFEDVACRVTGLFSAAYRNLFADAAVTERHSELWEEE